MAEQQHPQEVGSEAIDWLVGRLRWEHILRDLHDRAEGESAVDPVAAFLDAEDDDADADAA